MTSRNFWNYYRDKIDDVDGNASDGKSFIYKIVRKTPERLRNDRDSNRPPAPTFNVEFIIPI